MKKMMQTLNLTLFVLLATASFCYAKFAATGLKDFPFFHLGCLLVGDLTIVSIKHKYTKIYLSEAVGSFALYTVLVALFTTPVVDSLKTFVS